MYIVWDFLGPIGVSKSNYIRFAFLSDLNDKSYIFWPNFSSYKSSFLINTVTVYYY